MIGIALSETKVRNVLFNDAFNTFIYGYLKEKQDLIGIALSETKEGNVLFNDALNTFIYSYLKENQDFIGIALSERKERRKEMFNLTTHSTHLFTVIWKEGRKCFI